MKNSDNSGFTLIEILIAVIILAIVIVPLYHSFVSSHRVNAKSKQYMRATTLAQDEMEMFEKETIEELLAGVTRADGTVIKYYVDDTLYPDSNGRYVFVREDISNSSSTASTFDVEVTLDPQRASNTDRYYDTNSQALFYMNTIGRTDSAVYSQTSRSASNSKGYDDNIYEYFSQHVDETASGVGVNSYWTSEDYAIDYINKNLARRIRVRIYQENTGLNIATIVKVTYEYLLCEDNVMETGYQFYSEESIIYNNSAQSVDDDGNLPELSSVYLFYAPRYKVYKTSSIPMSPRKTKSYTVDGELLTYDTWADWIVIENEAELPVDVYVIRQDTFLDNSVTEVETVPIEYQPKLEIHDGVSDNHTIGHYFTNLNIDDPAASGVGQALTQPGNLIFKENGVPGGGGRPALSTIDPKPLNGTGSTQTETKDRIYTMTVKVYRHGVDKTAEGPIVTMTGSKLE